MSTSSVRRAAWLGVTLFLLGVAAGCEPRGTSEQPGRSDEPSGDGSTASAERAIRERGEQHARAVAARDTIGAGLIYAEDVVYLPADGAPEQGHDAVRAAWARGLSATDHEIRYRPETVEVSQSGDLAYERGLVSASRDGKPLFDGNYVYVWKKRDGEWRVTLYMWNTREAGD
jgi:ketosteroid isomerase-like protein